MIKTRNCDEYKIIGYEFSTFSRYISIKFSLHSKINAPKNTQKDKKIYKNNYYKQVNKFQTFDNCT